jgi:hypothetical protein
MHRRSSRTPSCDTDYRFGAYRYYSGRRIAARGVLVQVRYRIGFIDNAMGDALAEGVADRWPVRMKTVRRNLRRAEHALAKIADKRVRVLAVALAGAVGDDGLSDAANAMNVYWSPLTGMRFRSKSVASDNDEANEIPPMGNVEKIGGVWKPKGQ